MSWKTRARRADWCPLAAAVALFAAAPCAADLLVSELFYDAVGSDDGHSFVELSGEPGTPLDGLFVEGINGTGGGVTVSIALVGEIAEDGLFLLADVDADGGTSLAEADQHADFDFQNGPDSVLLRVDDEVLDAVGYGLFDGDDVFAGEGEPAPDAPAGQSLARLFADRDSDDNAADFVVEPEPTPGQAVFLPEPGAAWSSLVALATVGCLVGRERRSGRAAFRRAGATPEGS